MLFQRYSDVFLTKLIEFGNREPLFLTCNQKASHFVVSFVDRVQRSIKAIHVYPERRVLEPCCIHYKNLVGLRVVSSNTREVTSTCLVQFLSTEVEDAISLVNAARGFDNGSKQVAIKVVDECLSADRIFNHVLVFMMHASFVVLVVLVEGITFNVLNFL